MSQLQTLNNTIPSTFEGLTKSQISQYANTAVENILENGGALQVAEILATMEHFIKEVRKDERFASYVMEEAGKYPKGKYSTPSGTKIECIDSAGTFKYDKCGDPVLEMLEHDLTVKENEVKERREFLKTVPETGLDIIVPFTGEVVKVYRPYKEGSKATFKITIAK